MFNQVIIRYIILIPMKTKTLKDMLSHGSSYGPWRKNQWFWDDSMCGFVIRVGMWKLSPNWMSSLIDDPFKCTCENREHIVDSSQRKENTFARLFHYLFLMQHCCLALSDKSNFSLCFDVGLTSVSQSIQNTRCNYKDE